tara:strand:- start:674 stop:1816 length:1143 start_codon:yes stop_codon:yes gene_type:complete
VKKVKNAPKSAKTLKKWQKWLFEKKSPKKGTLRTIFLKKLRNIFLIYIKMTKKNMKTSKNEQKRAKTSNFFFCEKCDYKTSRRSNYDRHLESIKHLEKMDVKPKKWQKSAKKSVFKYCELCDYNASKKYNWEKHVQTIKHQKKVAKSGKKVANETEAKHKKTVKKSAESIKKEQDDIRLLTEKLNTIIETQNALTTQNITNINNNISINVFLDQYCNEALNLQDFVENIKFQLTDILFNNNLIENFVSKKLLKNLEDIPLTERPIHCTDVKRRNFLVKDKNEGWVKDSVDDNSSQLYKRVNQLHTQAYIDFYNEYDKQHPLPHDIDKERIKCKIAAELVSNKNRFNKVTINEIAKGVDIKDAIHTCPSIELTIDDDPENK